ncbi:MAG TPA: radical SAM protein, partial [Candidatus Acidoferrales bacterium]|nr:radical SAM protein [Candidatus Acidoferrales bacterium]
MFPHKHLMGMSSHTLRPSLAAREIVSGWKSILTGNVPFLSIEITRECPLSCPGCYAYGSEHLGGGITLRDLADFRGDSLVDGILALVKRYEPLHVSLVGGEPLMRHRELSQVLPELDKMHVHTMVVTSGVIPIPQDWMAYKYLRVAVSIDGLPEHHDIRRKPATYERILPNIEGRSVNVHWVITRPMLERPDYLEDYVAFWSGRPEVDHIWVSIYTPQIGEESPEKLAPVDRQLLAEKLPQLARRYPKFLMNQGIAGAIVAPPQNPEDCVFSKMSVNFSADLRSRVEPCVFGGTPDCTQCGCAISS